MLALLGCAAAGDIGPPPRPPFLATAHPDDATVVFPELRATWQIYPKDTVVKPDGSVVTDESKTLMAWDVEFSQVSANGTQAINTNQFLAFETGTVTGNETIRYDYDVQRISAIFRGGRRLNEWASLEYLLGGRMVSLEMEARALGAVFELNDDYLGIVVGGRASLHVVNRLSLYFQPSLTIDDDHEMLEIDLMSQTELFWGTKLLAGWRWWQLDHDRASPNSDIAIELSGPTIGFEVVF
ncbi:MAG: hypothetical protein AAF628_35770 [Planctomycetota bacterium]